MLTADILPALLRTVCLRPHDVDVRLVYADALEESGDVERAEFIRVQIELAGFTAPKTGVICCEGKGPPAEAGRRKKCRCQPCVLRRRERELLNTKPPRCEIANNEWAWFGFPFYTALGATMPNDAILALKRDRYRFNYELHNGFPDHLICDLATWLTHGPQFVLASPVVKVILSDVEVYTHEPPSPLRGCFVLRRDVGNVLWSLIQPDDSQVVSPLRADKQAALDALSTAALRWARIEAGLDGLCERCEGRGTVHSAGTLWKLCGQCHGTRYASSV